VDALDPGAQLLIVTAAAAALTGVQRRTRSWKPYSLAQEGHQVLVGVLGYELEFRLRRSILKRMAFLRDRAPLKSASCAPAPDDRHGAPHLASSCFTCRRSACFSRIAPSALATLSAAQPGSLGRRIELAFR